MNPKEIILLGLKNQVAAISRSDGRVLWSAKLPGNWGDGFVTVVCDDSRVYACASGQLHCLELSDGRVLWHNKLPGYGYGLASLCLPGGGIAPEAPIAAQHFQQQSANTGIAGATTG